jgi:hypothetical protein
MDTVIAGAYTNRGNALRDSGDMDQAIQDFNKAGLDPKLAAALGDAADGVTGAARQAPGRSGPSGIARSGFRSALDRL